jgi:hypothetical protein
MAPFRLRQRGDGGTEPAKEPCAGHVGPEHTSHPPGREERGPGEPGVRKRVSLRSPVRENCTPGSVRGASGNRRPYRDGANSVQSLIVIPQLSEE